MSPESLSPVSEDPASYGVGELASILGVTRQAVQARVKSGSIRAEKVNGVWQVPAAVAEAMISAERTKAVVSGRVTALPLRPAGDGDRLDDLAERFVRLETKLVQLEADRAAQADRFDQTMGYLREQLQARQGDIDALREDRRRLRRAMTALVADEDP
jgi:hypothetical protein